MQKKLNVDPTHSILVMNQGNGYYSTSALPFYPVIDNDFEGHIGARIKTWGEPVSIFKIQPKNEENRYTSHNKTFDGRTTDDLPF